VLLDEAESEYLSQQNLGRVATSAPDGQPHVVPVVYEFDGKYLYFSGWNLSRSLNCRNIIRNPRVAFVVDDLASVRPWKPRGLELRGLAEVFRGAGSTYVRITINSKRSWGFEGAEL
jgi:pyridoxamine 5'-phosphate oxidase family protein